jgi:hypothetical protein
VLRSDRIIVGMLGHYGSNVEGYVKNIPSAECAKLLWERASDAARKAGPMSEKGQNRLIPALEAMSAIPSIAIEKADVLAKREQLFHSTEDQCRSGRASHDGRGRGDGTLHHGQR